jgi:hypothetical protein
MAQQVCISFHGTYWPASRTVELFTHGMKLGYGNPVGCVVATRRGEGRACLWVGGGSQEGSPDSL